MSASPETPAGGVEAAGASQRENGGDKENAFQLQRHEGAKQQHEETGGDRCMDNVP